MLPGRDGALPGGSFREVSSVEGRKRGPAKGRGYVDRGIRSRGTPHERLPEILVVPREKTPTGAAARGNP